MPLFLQGILLGFSIAAPVGPIGVLCIRRALANGRWSGLTTGLGAATADAVYGAIAAFGLTAISGFLVAQQTWLRLLGGVFLVFLGLRTLLSRPAAEAAPTSNSTLAGDYASTFFLTLTNPLTILSFVAVFAGLGLTEGGRSYATAAGLVAGVFCGSALWWLTLSTAVSLFRTRFTPAHLRWVNIVSGLIIAGFGLLALISLVA
jgi:threonine/homoserine/homoserine lactone efflux protein